MEAIIKTCSACKEEKELSEFNRKGNTYQSKCRECNKKYTQQHYLDNKPKYKDRNIKKRKKDQTWFRELKGTLKCSRCDENHIACLDFHHKDASEKEENISHMLSRGSSRSAILAEISKCIILCSNCHRKEHYVAPSSSQA